jgi:hypothetical protein
MNKVWREFLNAAPGSLRRGVRVDACKRGTCGIDPIRDAIIVLLEKVDLVSVGAQQRNFSVDNVVFTASLLVAIMKKKDSHHGNNPTPREDSLESCRLKLRPVPCCVSGHRPISKQIRSRIKTRKSLLQKFHKAIGQRIANIQWGPKEHGFSLAARITIRDGAMDTIAALRCMRSGEALRSTFSPQCVASLIQGELRLIPDKWPIGEKIGGQAVRRNRTDSKIRLRHDEQVAALG